MRFKVRELSVCSAVILLTLIGATQCRLGPAYGQSAPAERPRLKDFGSSLKRLKWDSKKQAAVEKKPSARPGDSSEDDTIRVETNLVVCDVQVRDRRGNTVTGLERSDFSVSEDGQLQDIQHFSLGNDRSVGRTMVLLIDYSNSLAPYIENSVKAAKTLVDQLGPKDVMAVVTDDVKLLVDFTQDKALLKKKLDSLRQRSKYGDFGRSKQFSALMATVREMFNDEDIRPIVIFQTDGDELDSLRPSKPLINSNRSSYPVPFSLRDLYYAIERSRASVYAVIPGPRYLPTLTSSEMKQTAPTSELSERSLVDPALERFREMMQSWHMAAAGAAIGGWTAYLQRPEDANNIYSKILAEIDSRYVIGYYPTNKTHDGKRRKVLVEVRGHLEYSTYGRKSYFAAEPEP